MIDLFYRGGFMWMGFLTFLLLITIVLAMFFYFSIQKNRNMEEKQMNIKISYVKGIGLFAFMTGLILQTIGLYGAFQYIEAAGSVSASILADGFATSSITSVYGGIIFLTSYLMYLFLKRTLKQHAHANS